ncbi:MAG: hypothetical protein IKD62_02345 [Oscillospiraceae bacterium]|nr:hypothetical protein [Oscillospiraceae bacterium]MBR3585484.1 hypothetical protein [Oscillospiraceae bacterium]
MNHNRNYFGYPQPVRRDPELYRMMNETNRNLGKAGFFLGLLTVGGYALYRKVNDLSREVKKIKEEAGK